VWIILPLRREVASQCKLGYMPGGSFELYSAKAGAMYLSKRRNRHRKREEQTQKVDVKSPEMCEKS
jgi:hypothetical protein